MAVELDEEDRQSHAYHQLGGGATQHDRDHSGQDEATGDLDNLPVPIIVWRWYGKGMMIVLW